MLAVAISIASCERSFIKLKLIFSSLRTTMGEDRLLALALLSTERETTETINFDEVINTFASVKARKIVFLVTWPIKLMKQVVAFFDKL